MISLLIANWETALVAVVGIIYTAIAIGYWMHGNIAMSIVFFAYALANVGLMLVGLGLWTGK